MESDTGDIVFILFSWIGYFVWVTTYKFKWLDHPESGIMAFVSLGIIVFIANIIVEDFLDIEFSKVGFILYFIGWGVILFLLLKKYYKPLEWKVKEQNDERE